MSTLRSTALAAALALYAFAAQAEIPTSQLTAATASHASDVVVAAADANTSSPAVKASTASAAGSIDATFPQRISFDAVQNPTSCGGIPSPRMTPKDGYHTVCVNGALRFINEAEQYQYKVSISRMQKGERRVSNEFEILGPLGMPLTFASGNEIPYLQSVSTDAATGKTEAVPGKVFSGVFVAIDPMSRNENGSLNVETMFDVSDLISLDSVAVTGSVDTTIQTPHTQAVSEHSTVTVTPGKELHFDGDDLGVALSITRVN